MANLKSRLAKLERPQNPADLETRVQFLLFADCPIDADAPLRPLDEALRHSHEARGEGLTLDEYKAQTFAQVARMTGSELLRETIERLELKNWPEGGDDDQA